jgi:phenylalanyl-tRNA synthetase beta chain
MPGCAVSPAEAQVYEHPARAAVVEWRGTAAGRLFELHPGLMESGRAAILDIDLRAAQELSKQPGKYTPLRKFPGSAFDLSVVAGLREISAKIGASMREAAGPMCDSVEYLYSYRGNPLPEDRQSMTYRVTVSSPDHTLTTDEVNGVRSGIIEALRSQGYELRV